MLIVEALIVLLLAAMLLLLAAMLLVVASFGPAPFSELGGKKIKGQFGKGSKGNGARLASRITSSFLDSVPVYIDARQN